MDSGGARGGGPGLPRHSFADDPFFHNSFGNDGHEMFQDFEPGSRRRFGGSNPRLFDEDFFDNWTNNGRTGSFGNEPSFFRSSLPRRAPPASFDRPASSMHRQQTTPQRSEQSRSPNQQRKSTAEFSQPGPIHHQRQSSSNSHFGGGAMGNPPQPQNQQTSGNPTVHVIPVQQQQEKPAKNFVEINNAAPNSYTNGQLNPDKRRRFSNHFQSQQPAQTDSQNGMKVPIVKVEDYSNRSDLGSQDAISDQPIPLPPPPSLVAAQVSVEEEPPSPAVEKEKIEVEKTKEEGKPEEKKPAPQKKFVPLANCSEQLIGLLDESERRVEQLRETASQLEQEKELVLDILNNVKLTAEMLKLEQSEEDEVNLMAEHILKRCRAVDVVVNTPRNEDQTRALDEVNQLIQSVVTKMQDDLEATKFAVQRFLNACSPDEPNGPIDQRFQAKIVACTADDQKKVRRRLTQIIAQTDRAERVCMPN